MAALAVAGPATAGPDGADTSTAPWIASDKPDYAPGERVTLDGGNWRPGESVRIEVEDDQGKTWQRDVTVDADAAGRIADSFDLPDWFVATYAVKATGSSGAVATASFTDGNVTVRARAGTTAIAVSFPAGSAESFNNTTCAGTPAASNASPFTTPTNNNYTNSGVAANNSQSASVEAPSPVTIGGTTYVFASWSADGPSELTVSTTGTTGCFSRGPSPSNNPAWNMTANYVAAPTTVGTTTTAANANATYGDSSVTLTATVTPASGPAVGAGTVTFTVKQASETIGTATSGTVSSGSASASFPLAGVVAGTYTIEASYGGAGGFDPSSNASQSPAPTLTVGPKTVTGSFTAANKVYDGSDTATITGRSLSGVVGGDDVDLSGGTATFANENVGSGKTVTGTGFTLSGAKAGNYALSASTLTTTADITAKAISGGFTAADKTYDGTADATITGRSLSGAIAGDDVALSGGTASFDDKHAGADKPVTGSGFALAGDDKDNYTLTSVANATASITAKAITGSVSVADKVYDGTADATITGRSLNGAIAGDDVALSGGTASFNNKHAGADKPVSVSGASLAGDDKDNYALGAVTANDADITPLGITGGFTAADKTYDGTADATITGRSLSGAIAGDDVALSGGTASFDDKHAGADKPVTGSGFALAGDDKDNYTLTSVANATASITPKALTGSFTAADKEYDGTRNASVSGTSLPGVIGDDDVSLEVANALFETKHVGSDKDVTGDLSLSGDDAGNYGVNASHTTKADIAPKGITGGFTAANKTYDGTADATITGRSLNGAIAGDDVALSGGTASFNDKHAGADKPVTGSGFALAGDDKDNYTLTSVADTTASITARGLDVSAHGVDKVYDGTTAASVTFSDDRIAGDTFTIAYTAAFADKHVGADKPVSVSAIALSGADAGNYELGSTTASTTADITPRALTVSASGVNKVYDGTTDATVNLSDDRVSGDDLSLSYAGAAFADANAGTGKPVSVTGIAVTGPDAGNYTHNTTASTTATIAPRPITVTADAKSKAFGAPDPALTYQVSGGPLVAGDGFSGSLTRVAGEGVGSYDILQGTVSAGPNYAIAYVGAKLTIGGWHATGFYQPIGSGNSQFVAAPGPAPHVSTAVWNTAKGGSTIPLKFNLYTTQGGLERTSTADVKEFQAVKLAMCTGGDGEEAIEFVTTGSTSLRYDATERQFVQNWKTPAVSKEECYRVNVRFQDGSAIYAFVKLRK